MRLLTPLVPVLFLAGLIAGCASTGIDSDDPHAPMHEGHEPAPVGSSMMDGAQTDDAGPGRAETVRSGDKPDWAAVYETPAGTRYHEQRLIYVDRHSLHEHKLDRLTYYTATTREVRPAASGAHIQELAVLCEGTPIAPATSLRGESSENSDGSYRIKHAKDPISSLSQFSTQRIPIDARVPSTFVVRAICMLGTDPHR